MILFLVFYRFRAETRSAGSRAAEETLLEIAAAAAEEIAHVEREASMTSRATKVGALNEAGIRMISATDPAEVLRMATSSVAMALGADHAILRVQDDETRRYVIRSYFGSADGRLQERLFRLDKRISVEVIKKRAPRLIARPRGRLRAERTRFGFPIRDCSTAPARRVA